jgi:hypothetical protein
LPLVSVKQVKRPVGVTVIAVWNIILAVLLGLGGLIGAVEMAGEDHAAAAVAGVFIVGLAVLAIIVAVGLLHLRNWARITATVLYGINALAGFIELLLGNPFGLVGLVVALTILIYLNRAQVREAFTSHLQTEITSFSPSVEASKGRAGESEPGVGLDTTS